MQKRRSSLNPAQLAFTFDAPPPATEDASLAGLDRLVAACVARVLKEDERNRFEVAAAMSALLDEEVTKAMLDAYAAEARDNHNISAARFMALVAVTDRHDVLDAVVTRIGGRVLVGDEIRVAELGHIDRQLAALQKRKTHLQAMTQPIDRGGGNE